jgi:hypothetical protein
MGSTLRLAPPAIQVERRGGNLYLRSPQKLAPYARCVTEWLVKWSERAPERTFVAERKGAGWRKMSYRETYGAVRRQDEFELSKYSFEIADPAMAALLFDRYEPESRRALEAGLVLPAYEAALACSHQFNMLDARGAVSATDRVGLIRRVRDLACACARAYVVRGSERTPAPEPEPAGAR